MKFETFKYRQTRETVIDLIKDTHAWETIEGFIADGVICPDIYEKEEIKILIILAESYGYSHSKLIDIEEQLEEDIMGVGNSKVQTPKKIGTLLWLLFKSIELGKEIEWENFPGLLQTNDFNYSELQKVLSRIAWINIKKASKNVDEDTSTRLNYMEIYNSGTRNKDILKLQISSIAPDLIIASSDPVFHSLYDNKLLGEGIDRDAKFVVQTNLNGQKIIHMSHPSYLKDWSYEGIFETFQIIYKNLCLQK